MLVSGYTQTMNDIRKLFDFTTYLEGFKKMERFVGQVFWKDYPSPSHYESNADHTWRMAMMLISLEDHLAKPIDFKKAMKMLLIHDIPEMIAGDPSPLGTDGSGTDSHAYNKNKAEEKFEREKMGALEIFAKLPSNQAKELFDLWLEFEHQESYESKVVKAIDKLEGKLQAFEYTKGVVFKEHGDFNAKYGNETYGIDPAIEEFGNILLKEMRDNYVEFKKPLV